MNPTAQHTAFRAAPRRATKPTQISVVDLARYVQASIDRAEEFAARPQRPMATNSAFEKMYRENERRSDRFSCFLACLSGAMGAAAPDAAAKIYAFIETVQLDVAPPAVAADQTTTEGSTTPCQQ